MSATDQNTGNDVRTLLQTASECYDREQYEGAIELYDRVIDANDLGVNTYMVQEHRAMAYCKVGRFEEAERELSLLADMIEAKGGRLASSKVMFWLLVARHKGDEKKAMSEFIAL
jgi:tetratricopeptide (TPR) repeat protein